MLALDYQNPNYTEIMKRRATMLRRLRLGMREGRGQLMSLKAYYRANPIDFVCDWGMTSDPRNIERGLPGLTPFVPFRRQIEWMQWLLDRWRAGESGLTEKTRDMGCSVAAMSLLSTLALFNRDFVAGCGSRKEDLVDRVGDPSTLFFKARMFLSHVPEEFRGGWYSDDKVNNSHLKINIPETGSVIIGEAGTNIGRGGRASIYLVDESAFLANPHSVEASLSQTTRCRIDLSSVNGTDNPFAEKRFSGRVEVFTFHWRDDPRKNQEWYDRQVQRLPPVVVASEIDINYSASKEGVLIPSEWVQAAIGLKLPDYCEGLRSAALDVADEGGDKNALATRDGVILTDMQEWSGVGIDLFATTDKAVNLCDQHGVTTLTYDADGMGVGVRGDMRVINSRPDRQRQQIETVAFQGSGSPVSGDDYVIAPDPSDNSGGRTNRDFFANRKAQGWWALRTRFQNAYKASQGAAIDPAECIAIPPALDNLQQLAMELSQPTYSLNTSGKISVDKAPNGSKSPNLADALMILFAPTERVPRGMFDV